MGMFDELRCDYPLPVEGMEGRIFQTKDTRRQTLDLYEIREDGTFWHQDYDIEDRSDPSATGMEAARGVCTPVNKRWVKEKITDEIYFYGFKNEADSTGWIEFKATIVGGQVLRIEVVEDNACPGDSMKPAKDFRTITKTEARIALGLMVAGAIAAAGLLLWMGYWLLS